MSGAADTLHASCTHTVTRFLLADRGGEGRGGAEGKIDLVGEGSKGPEFDFVA